jgi:16S rRNA (guanine(966)-N(2))-methyltransferase RsmD
MNKNTHHSCISISRRIQHHHRSCSLRAKKKTYESSEEAAEDLLFYNEEDLLEEDEEGVELLEKTRKLSAEELIIEDRELAMLGLDVDGEDADYDDEDDDIDGLFIEGEDGESMDIASFLKKNGKIDSENDFDFEEDLNFDVSDEDEDDDNADDDEDDEEDDFVFIPKGSGIEFKSEDLYNIDSPTNKDFGFLSEYVKTKPGYEEDIDGEGDESNRTTTINTATRSPRKSRSKNDVFIRDTSKDKAPKTSEVEREQELVDAVNDKKKKKNLDSFGEEKKTHKRLQIVAGRHSRRVVLTPSGLNTRPMMGVVRGATFDMILSLVGSRSNVQFPENSRWLDLFAGTGAIGLEALSRGCVDAHFVEMDDWTVKNVTRVNIKTLGEEKNATAHCASVETFLQRHSKNTSGVGGAFNFVSFCPPYEKVSYPDLLLEIDSSLLVSDDAIVLVEYAIGQRDEIKASIGNRLRRVRNRRYGRTFVALYVCDGRELDDDVVEEPKLHGKAMK